MLFSGIGISRPQLCCAGGVDTERIAQVISRAIKGGLKAFRQLVLALFNCAL